MPSKSVPVHVVLTGVCGTGKSSVAKALSLATGIPVANAGDFHPAINRRKLASGQDLCQADLTGWLHRLRDWIADRAVSGTSAIVTCPPLRREHRDVLREAEDVSAYSGNSTVRLLVVELTAPRDTLASRLANRSDHLIPVSVLDEQLAHREPLEDDEFGVSIDASGDQDAVAERVVAAVTRLRTGRIPPVGVLTQS